MKMQSFGVLRISTAMIGEAAHHQHTEVISQFPAHPSLSPSNCVNFVYVLHKEVLMGFFIQKLNS